MRGAAWTLSLLFLLAPLGLAQDGGQSRPGDGPCADEDDDEARQECQRQVAREHCQEHPDDARCKPQDDGRQGNRTDDDDGAREGCRDGGQDNETADRCEEAVRKIRDERGRDWISFEVDAANATLIDYTVGGLLALEELRLDLDGGNLTIERQGAMLRVRDGEAELRLHDNPNGLIHFKGEDGNVTLEFPANATIQRDQDGARERGEHGARIAYVEGREGHLVADNATWHDNATVQLNGFFVFHVPPAEGRDGEDDEGQEQDEAEEELDDRKQDAIERRTLGAEITLKPRGMNAAAIALNDSVEVLAYDDVEVKVDYATLDDPDVPIRVEVSSELDEGRTIVLNVDEDLLASTDPADIVLRYFDLHNQTDGTTLETEVVFKVAGSLQDVLEPGDDGGQPEFWVVEDANGVQVLVSVPHWSAHAITVASIATALHAPSVAVGIVAGVAASALAGVLLLWPRRRDDEL